ncbi:hypothetical protein TNCV_2770271 [Trichonephila clavipes]|nr:hypothetical protein TNCV_2770271 [Trichonephila clavipes]
MLNDVCLLVNSCLQGKDGRKGFLHRIATGDEKWVHYDNPKRRISRPCFQVDGQTEHSRFQGLAQHLMGPARRSVL